MRLPILLLTSLLASAAAHAPAHAQATHFGDVSLETEVDSAAANGTSYTVYADNVAGERLLFHCDHDGVTAVLATGNVVTGDSLAVAARWTGTTRRFVWQVNQGSATARAHTYLASRGAPARDLLTISTIVPDLELRYATTAGETRSRFTLRGLSEALQEMQCPAL